MATYKFPLDLEDTKYEARIHFNARKVKAFDVDFLFSALGESTASAAEAKVTDPG